MVIVIHQASSTANAFFYNERKAKEGKATFTIAKIHLRRIHLFTQLNTATKYSNVLRMQIQE